MTGPNRLPIDPAERRWILHWYRQGGAELASLASGRSRAAVTRLAHRNGVRAREWRVAEREAAVGAVEDLHREGRSLAELAGLFGVSRDTIRVWLRFAGVDARRSGSVPRVEGRRRELVAQARRAEKAARLEVVAERYLAGESTVTIAESFGVWDSTVRNWLRSAGVRLRAPGRAVRDPLDRETAARLYRAGWSLADLGAHFGVAEVTVRSWLVAEGVQIRPRGGAHRSRPVPVGSPSPARPGAAEAVLVTGGVPDGWAPPSVEQIAGHVLVDGWQGDARCRGLDPNLFHPERGEPTAETKAVCSRCPVVLDCATFAVRNGEKYGVWGGLSERQRREIRRRLRLGEAA